MDFLDEIDGTLLPGNLTQIQRARLRRGIIQRGGRQRRQIRHEDPVKNPAPRRDGPKQRKLSRYWFSLTSTVESDTEHTPQGARDSLFSSGIAVLLTRPSPNPASRG